MGLDGAILLISARPPSMASEAALMHAGVQCYMPRPRRAPDEDAARIDHQISALYLQGQKVW